MSTSRRHRKLSADPEDRPEAGEGSVEKAFLRRAWRAVEGVAEGLPPAALSAAVGAATDMDTLIYALLRPEAAAPTSRDRLDAARLRGVLARRHLLEEEGGTLSAEEVGEVLRITRQAVNKRRQTGTLLALPVGRHGYAYPVWQLGEKGMLEGFVGALRELAGHDSWMQARFFLNRNDRLDGERPLDELRRGRHEAVLAAARAYGEQAAA